MILIVSKKMLVLSFILILFLVSLPSPTKAGQLEMSNHASRLYDDLMSKYNKKILPVANVSTNVNVKILLKLVQLVDVDEKNQLLTVNVWVKHQWKDHYLTWNPKDYGGVDKLHLPSDLVWLPDTVLYNNGDGNYQITIETKIKLYHDGTIVWEPPAIYKSSCTIDVKFFPFDQQECFLKIGPWTYDQSRVDYNMQVPGNEDGETTMNSSYAVDLAGYYQSVEWDILSARGKKFEFKYACCPEIYIDVKYYLSIRRKTLFYTINLLIPCVSISFLTLLVFYLPSESCEKITLSISILLSLTVFMLLLFDIIPPTSLALPLIGKYLLFTMVLVTFSIIVTVAILNFHFRHPHTYKMPEFIRKVFLEFLPKIMMMKRPESTFDRAFSDETSSRESLNSMSSMGGPNKQQGQVASSNLSRARKPETSSMLPGNFWQSGGGGVVSKTFSRLDRQIAATIPTLEPYLQYREVKSALKGIQYIAEQYKSSDDDDKLRDDWETVARVLDRFFLYIFTTACVIGTGAILLGSPTLYDSRPDIGLQYSTVN